MGGVPTAPTTFLCTSSVWSSNRRTAPLQHEMCRIINSLIHLSTHSAVPNSSKLTNRVDGRQILARCVPVNTHACWAVPLVCWYRTTQILETVVFPEHCTTGVMELHIVYPTGLLEFELNIDPRHHVGSTNGWYFVWPVDESPWDPCNSLHELLVIFGTSWKGFYTFGKLKSSFFVAYICNLY